MNDIHVYSIQTYEMKILHDYYCQIVTHEICDEETIFFPIFLFVESSLVPTPDDTPFFTCRLALHTFRQTPFTLTLLILGYLRTP
jgi:hypothetical protein